MVEALTFQQPCLTSPVSLSSVTSRFHPWRQLKLEVTLKRLYRFRKWRGCFWARFPISLIGDPLFRSLTSTLDFITVLRLIRKTLSAFFFLPKHFFFSLSLIKYFSVGPFPLPPELFPRTQNYVGIKKKWFTRFGCLLLAKWDECLLFKCLLTSEMVGVADFYSYFVYFWYYLVYIIPSLILSITSIIYFFEFCFG